MKILIDLDEKILSRIMEKAKEERRKRKQMIELLLERAVQTQMYCAKCGKEFEYREDHGIDLCRKCYKKYAQSVQTIGNDDYLDAFIIAFDVVGIYIDTLA